MTAVFELRHEVSAEEIDEMGHVGNVVYLKWLQRAAAAHTASLGWPRPVLVALGGGFVVRRHEIDYIRPAMLGDQLVVRTWVGNLKRATSLRKYEIRRVKDGRLVAQAATDWAFVDLSTGLPRRIPQEIADTFVVLETPPVNPTPGGG